MFVADVAIDAATGRIAGIENISCISPSARPTRAAGSILQAQHGDLRVDHRAPKQDHAPGFQRHQELRLGVSDEHASSNAT